MAELEDVGETIQPSSGPGVLIKVTDREATGEFTLSFLSAYEADDQQFIPGTMLDLPNN